MRSLDVTIVGAGPAGLGMALTLLPLPGLHWGILERGQAGESFRRWPRQTRFITPSFHSNPFGLADLNAISPYSSLARFTGTEHPSGAQYADYLQAITEGQQLPLVPQCSVEQVIPAPGDGFLLYTSQGELHTRFLIWATGEYQFPDLSAFPGADLCRHYAQVSDWTQLATCDDAVIAHDAAITDRMASTDDVTAIDGDAATGRRVPAGSASARHAAASSTAAPCDHTVIGGYESGIDAAIQLVRLGRRVRLLCRGATWGHDSAPDPSLSLSPFTHERLRQALATGRLDIVYGVDVMAVTNNGHCCRIHAADGRYWDTLTPPVLGTGFQKGGGARQIADLWEWRDDGHLALSPLDESTVYPGLFLVGPQVRHDERIYCFIYKFRQRFGLIAREITRRLDIDASALETPPGNWGPFGNSDCCEGCEC